MHCFDKRFVIPAAVSFFSMLSNANKSFYYNLYVLHSDIDTDDQDKLHTVVKGFPNAKLHFVKQNEIFKDIFQNLKIKGHYSKEVFFKLIAPVVFKDLDYMIITDVDVIFLGDISKPYLEFIGNSDYYIAGVKCLLKKGSWVEAATIESYKNDFNDQEQQVLTNMGGGFLIYNLNLMREANVTDNLLNCLSENVHRLRQAEQDVLNLVCHANTFHLHPRTMICTYNYEIYTSESDYSLDAHYPAETVKESMKNPIQLHYAGPRKPWIYPNTTHASLWYKYLFKTTFADEFKELMEKWTSRSA